MDATSTSTSTSAELLDRYARLLGLDRSAAPTLETLRALVRAHFWNIPFENVSILTGLRESDSADVFTFERYIDGAERLDLGGTCIVMTPYLLELVRHLGFDADLLLADLWSKRSGRGLGLEHCVLKVRIDGAAYLVDVGFAAPFYDPVPLDELATPVRVEHGNINYTFDVGEPPACVTLLARRGEEPLYRYDVHPEPRDREYFYRERIRADFRPGKAKFLAQLSIIRFSPTRVLEVRNRKLLCTEGGETRVTELESLDALERCVHEQLELPRMPVRTAVEVLSERCDLRLY